MVSVAIRTICDMVDHARLRLDDLSPVALVPTTNLELIQQAAEDADEGELLWSTPELRHYANEAIREVAIRTHCLRDSGRDRAGLTSYAVTAGDNWITVDPRVLYIKRVWWNDSVLAPDSELFLDQISNTWRTNTTDEPCRFVLERASRRLQLVGVPTLDGTIKLDVVRLPIEILETGTPEIPQQYLSDCIDWMCSLAYLKNDADATNPELSMSFAKEFERKVGPRPSDLQLQLEFHQSGRRRARLYYY